MPNLCNNMHSNIKTLNTKLHMDIQYHFAREVSSINDPVMRWEYVKYKCREFSRSYSLQKAKERKSLRISLEKRIAELESLISSSSSQELLAEYNKCKSDLETLYDYKCCRNNFAIKVRLV